MKKLILLMTAFTLICFSTSCTKDESSTNEKDVLNSFKKQFGISQIQKNVKVNLSKVEGLQLHSVGVSSKSIDDLSTADEVYNYENGDKAYIFKFDDDEKYKSYVIKVNSLGDLLTEKNIEMAKDLLNNLSFTFNVYSPIENQSYSVQILNGVAQEPELIGVAGKRKPGESFGACFKRTWNEFCDDALGIIATVLAPREIAVAVAISCV
jgi:hypothetical protein